MRVLVACEFSGIVRDAFLDQGHSAMSCDLEPTETPGPHYQGDVLEIIGGGWDLMIAHPPCTYLCNSGAKHLYINGRRKNGRDVKRWTLMFTAAKFFNLLLAAPIPRICIENPIQHGYAQTLINKPYAQIIQPWMFGHGETKATCLWLKNLPRLVPTDIVPGRRPRVHRESPGPDRQKNRSRTMPGIAVTMAAQWGEL